MKYRYLKVRSGLKPRWWELRLRLYFWRLARSEKKIRARLGPEALQALNRLEKDIEREILFGSNGSHDRI